MFSFFSTTIETNLFIFIFLDILYIFYEFIFSFIPYSQKDNVRLNCDTILSPFNIFQRSLNQFQYKILLLERNYATLSVSPNNRINTKIRTIINRRERRRKRRKNLISKPSLQKKRGKKKKHTLENISKFLVFRKSFHGMFRRNDSRFQGIPSIFFPTRQLLNQFSAPDIIDFSR